MKVSMSNREYSKVRKHFKTMFKYGNLTKEVCESEEYLNFEKEEKKRKEARDFVENFLRTMKDNPYFTDLKRKIDIYNMKFFSFVEKREQLKEYVAKLYKNKKIDFETLVNFPKCNIYNLNDCYRGIPIFKIEKYSSFGSLFSKIVEYKENIEYVLLKLRRIVCEFSVELKKMEKEVKDIEKRIPKLSEKRRKEDAEQQAKEKAEQAKLEKLDEKQKVAELKYRAEAKARELESQFSNYRYYQDKKSR